MNQLRHILLGASAIAMAAVSSCTSTDDAAMQAPTRQVNMTVVLSKDGGAESRTAFNEVDGSLACTWTATDRIVLADNEGKKIGTLAIDPKDAGQSTARFEGKIEVSGEKQTMNFLYLGNLTNAEAATSSVSYNYGTQKGTLESLADYDFFWQRAEVTLGATEAFATVESMQRSVSFGHFNLSFPADAGWTGGDVTISGSGLVTNATLAFTGTPAFSGASGSIATKATADGDVYVTIIPVTTDLVFTATVGEKTYTGSLPSREWKANEYVRKDLGNGTFAGVEVAMTAEKDNNGELNEYGEPVNNPLAKWAKGNLTRAEDGSNTFAANGDGGALYQWGRNYGFIDNGGIYENSYMIDGSPWSYNKAFSNFIDAMGNMDYEAANNQWGVMDYFVYCTDPNGQQKGSSITCGTGMHYSDSFYFDQPHFYSSVEDIKANTNRYFMDGTPGTKVRGYGTYYFGMDELNNNADYWVSTFGDGGTTWTVRAKACGYENTNPCPEGWRLPTEAEMREIAPENGLDQSKGYLSSMLSGYSELRQTQAGIRYAIRWLYESNAITIETVIVDDSYTNASQLTTLFWDQNKANKVVREFPFTGTIRPFIGSCDTPFYQSVYICRPHHFGLADFGVWPLTVGYQDYEYGIVGPADAGNFNPGFGGYWVEEKGVAFKFATRDIASSLSYSCLLVENAEPVSAYAIRPVRAESKAE